MSAERRVLAGPPKILATTQTQHTSWAPPWIARCEVKAGPMGNRPKRDRDENERQRRLIQLATAALLVAHDVLRLVIDLVNR
jgi:hypothetical protein